MTRPSNHRGPLNESEQAMITEKKGDITTVTSGIILHGVNCQGVMGAGVAKAIRDKWPQVYDDYRSVWRGHAQQGWPGPLMGQVACSRINDNLAILSLFTQKNYGRDMGRRYVSYDAIGKCLTEVASSFTDADVHFPLIGCGLGGGHWPIVREIIEFRLPDGRFNKTLWML